MSYADMRHQSDILTSLVQGGIILAMRTTLNLDDATLRRARDYARRRSLPLGRAVSELVQRGLTTPLRTKVVKR